MSSSVLLEQKNNVLTIILNREDSKNALTDEIIYGLSEGIERAANDPSIRCVVITGTGNAFCAGGNIKQMESSINGGNPIESRDRIAKIQSQLITKLLKLEKPIIAAINGWAVGAGLSLALCADIRIAAKNSKFAMSFVRVGLVPDLAGMYLFPRIIGLGKAKELAITGKNFDAEEALRLNLVSELVEDSQLLIEAIKLAEEIAQGPTKAIGMVKTVMTASFEKDLTTHFEYEAAYQAILKESTDHKEGVRAFLEKRKPDYKGI